MYNIKYLVMDVDGTLTDGKIYIGASGEIMKAFNAKDGYGICNLLTEFDLVPIVITGRRSDIVINRCRELKITGVYQGVQDKKECLQAITSDFSEVAYIGDDLNDLNIMRCIKEAGGIVGCPKDAVKQVLEIVDFVSVCKGGEGAVRDFIEWIIGE